MLPPFGSRLRSAEALCARKGLALPAVRSRGGPTLAAGTFSTVGWGTAALGAIAGPGTLALSCFASDVLLPVVSDDPAGVTAAISADARFVTSTWFAGAMDATDMCMNSKYPPTVTTEAPASAIVPEANF